MKKYSHNEAVLEAELLKTRRDQFGESYQEGEKHVDEDTKVVIDILNESRDRIEGRKELVVDLPEDEKEEQMAELRQEMFSRKNKGDAFYELSDQELALLENEIEKYTQEGRLRVVDSDIEQLILSYRAIRHDLLTEREEISPAQFREASSQIIRIIFEDIIENNDLDPKKDVILLPWRAALAFGNAATDKGFENFYHLGAKRNEQTLQTEIYYEEVPEAIDGVNIENNKDLKVVIADPMLATGNTMIDSIERLKKMGIAEKNITITSVISAPEGIDHILSEYPEINITVGSHDEKLNKAGYIVPGLGDFGDKHFEDLEDHEIEEWKKSGLLTADAEKALRDKLSK